MTESKQTNIQGNTTKRTQIKDNTKKKHQVIVAGDHMLGTQVHIDEKLKTLVLVHETRITSADPVGE